MRRFTRVLLLSPVLLLARAAVAEEGASQPTLEQIQAKLKKTTEQWGGCEPGSWVEMKSVATQNGKDMANEYRQTLVSRTEKATVLETRMITRKKADDGTEKVEMGDPMRAEVPTFQQTSYEDLKDVRTEDVEIEGRKVACRVIEATLVQKLPQPVNGTTDFRTPMTLWWSAEVKVNGGLVKQEGDLKTGGNWSVSWGMKLAALDREFVVGGKTLKCAVYKYDNTSNGEKNVASGEVWMCEDVPFGYVKSEGTSRYDMGGTKLDMKFKMELTGVGIVKEKTE